MLRYMLSSDSRCITCFNEETVANNTTNAGFLCVLVCGGGGVGVGELARKFNIQI